MKSIWQETCTLPTYPALPGHIQTGAAIIGGGMAGLLTAYYLTRSGVPAVVLEARHIGSGQTAHTTAKITSQHNLIYSRLLQRFGEEQGRLYAAANQHAISEYERLVRSRDIDCDFTREAAVLYSQKETEPLRREAAAARLFGIPATITADTELPFPVQSALVFPDQARFHPLKFLKAITEGLTIYENTPVLSVKEGPDSYHTLHTPHGTVSAKHVVFACHYPFPNIPGFYFSRIYQKRSYVLALRDAAGITAFPDGMYLGIDSDGLSFRTAGDILLLGGQGHRTGACTSDPYKALEAAARTYFPHTQTVARWSAQDCMTLDGVPYIGRFSSRRPDWYIATGFGKWGMTSSMIAALMIQRLICGEPSPWSPVFSPKRLRLRASRRELASHMAASTRGLTAGLIHPRRRCPHMGCALVFNPWENTWECPCHGSRFSQQGKLLSGPAQQDLAPPPPAKSTGRKL